MLRRLNRKKSANQTSFLQSIYRGIDILHGILDVDVGEVLYIHCNH